MAQIILYNPAEIREPKIPHIPLGLLSIGSILKHEGYEVKIIDSRIEDNAKDLIFQYLNEDTIFFGITCLSGPPIFDVLKIMEIVKKRNNTPIVLGGYHPSLCTDQTIEHPFVDFIVRGQGEDTIVHLADALNSGKSLEEIEGISYKKYGQVFNNKDRPLRDINNFPEMDYSLLDIEKYIKVDGVGSRTIDYITSRGCVNRCTYCAISALYGRKYSALSVECVMNEIEQLIVDYTVNGIRFLDDNFFNNKIRAEKICDEIIGRNIKAKFWSMCRINLFSKFDDTFLFKLKRANFTTFNFGAESGSQEVLDTIKKDISVEQIKKTAGLCKKHGIMSQFSFMIGFPFETKEQMNATIDLMNDIYEIDNSTTLRLFIFTPLPGTPLYVESINHGFKPPKNLSEWQKYKYDSVTTPWIEYDRSLYEILPHIVMFAFTPLADEKMHMNVMQKVFYKVFRKIAQVRFKNKLFKFAFEWKLIALYLNWKGKKSKAIVSNKNHLQKHSVQGYQFSSDKD